MNNSYEDIRSRIAEPPTWFDESAVPRYGQFNHENMEDIYAKTRALVRVACQCCRKEFWVAMSWGRYESPSLEDVPFLQYGDPPNVGCCASGPTMCTELLRVGQWWQCNENHEWERRPEFEGSVRQLKERRSIWDQFLAAPCEDEQLDVIYEGIDHRLRQGQFPEVDAILTNITDAQMAAMPTVCLLAWVSITHAAAHVMPDRPVFLARVRRQLELVEPDRVEELLRGFNA